MTLLVFALIVLLIGGAAAWMLNRYTPDPFATIGPIVVLIVAIIVIAQRAGYV